MQNITKHTLTWQKTWTGGSDLQNKEPQVVAKEVAARALQLRNTGSRFVLIMGYLHRAQHTYNNKANELNDILLARFPDRLCRHLGVRFWQWDWRLPKSVYDATHL